MTEPRLEPLADRLGDAGAELLRAFGGQPWSQDFYLAGSAALALYLSHRRVRDLDLMGWGRLTSPERRDLLQDLVCLDPGVRVETARDGFLHVRFANDVGLRLFYYPYPLIDPEEEVSGVVVASALDLALMKLGAITSRGSRRDFVDIFLLCQRLPLPWVLERSVEKFGHVRDFPLQALKGLTDLEGARGEPMPTLTASVTWADVEAWVRGEVRQVARERIGLGSTVPSG